jgi:hypothetical protein
MHFSFNLLRIKGLYMFRALLAHIKEAPHKWPLVYRVCIMSVSCGMIAVKLQSCHSQLTLYTHNIPSAVCLAPPEDEQVMLETCRGPWFSINWMKSASCWFHYTDILWCTVSKTLNLELCYIPINWSRDIVHSPEHLLGASSTFKKWTDTESSHAYNNHLRAAQTKWSNSPLV